MRHRKDYKDREKTLEFYIQLITEIYLAWCKLHGVTVTSGGTESRSLLLPSNNMVNITANPKIMELKKLVSSTDCTLNSLAGFITAPTQSNNPRNSINRK